MTDEGLLVSGCAISFLALAGGWIFLRGRMLDFPVLRTRKRGPKVEETRKSSP